MRAAHERELRDRYERQLQDQKRLHGKKVEEPLVLHDVLCYFVAEMLEKKLKRERKVVKRLRHQLQIAEHMQQPRSDSLPRDRMEGRADDEAPKLNRMQRGELQFSCCIAEKKMNMHTKASYICVTAWLTGFKFIHPQMYIVAILRWAFSSKTDSLGRTNGIGITFASQYTQGKEFKHAAKKLARKWI